MTENAVFFSLFGKKGRFFLKKWSFFEKTLWNLKEILGVCQAGIFQLLFPADKRRFVAEIRTESKEKEEGNTGVSPVVNYLETDVFQQFLQFSMGK